MSTIAVVAAPLLAVAVAFAAPVHAATPYPPPPPTVAVNTTTTTAGGAVTVSYCGFDPGETVSITLGTANLGSDTAGSDGCGSASVTMPAGAGGSQEIALTGAVSGRVATVEVTIVAGGSASGLPNTGVPVRPFGLVAGALILAGLVFVGASRSRRRRAD